MKQIRNRQKKVVQPNQSIEKFTASARNQRRNVMQHALRRAKEKRARRRGG